MLRRKRKPADPWKKNRWHRWMPLPIIRLSETNYVCRHCLTLVGIPTLSGVTAPELYGGRIVPWTLHNRRKIWKALQKANMRQAREEAKANPSLVESNHRLTRDLRHQLETLRYRLREDEEG